MILQPMHQPAPVRRQREAPGKWFLYGEQHLPPGGSEIVKLHSSGPPLVLSGNKIDPLLCRHEVRGSAQSVDHQHLLAAVARDPPYRTGRLCVLGVVDPFPINRFFGMQPAVTRELLCRATADRNTVDLKSFGSVVAEVDPLAVSRPTRLDAVAELLIGQTLHGAVAYRDSVKIGTRAPGVEQNRAVVQRPPRIRRMAGTHTRELNRVRAVRIRNPHLLKSAARGCKGDAPPVVRVCRCPRLIRRCCEPLWRGIPVYQTESPEVHLGPLARVHQRSVGGDAERRGPLAETFHSCRAAGIEVKDPQTSCKVAARGIDDSPVVHPRDCMDGDLAIGDGPGRAGRLKLLSQWQNKYPGPRGRDCPYEGQPLTIRRERGSGIVGRLRADVREPTGRAAVQRNQPEAERRAFAEPTRNRDLFRISGPGQCRVMADKG